MPTSELYSRQGNENSDSGGLISDIPELIGGGEELIFNPNDEDHNSSSLTKQSNTPPISRAVFCSPKNEKSQSHLSNTTRSRRGFLGDLAKATAIGSVATSPLLSRVINVAAEQSSAQGRSKQPLRLKNKQKLETKTSVGRTAETRDAAFSKVNGVYVWGSAEKPLTHKLLDTIINQINSGHLESLPLEGGNTLPFGIFLTPEFKEKIEISNGGESIFSIINRHVDFINLMLRAADVPEKVKLQLTRAFVTDSDSYLINSNFNKVKDLVAQWCFENKYSFTDYTTYVDFNTGTINVNGKKIDLHFIHELMHAVLGQMTGSAPDLNPTQNEDKTVLKVPFLNVNPDWQWYQGELRKDISYDINGPLIPNIGVYSKIDILWRLKNGTLRINNNMNEIYYPNYIPKKINYFAGLSRADSDVELYGSYALANSRTSQNSLLRDKGLKIIQKGKVDSRGIFQMNLQNKIKTADSKDEYIRPEDGTFFIKIIKKDGTVLVAWFDTRDLVISTRLNGDKETFMQFDLLSNDMSKLSRRNYNTDWRVNHAESYTKVATGKYINPRDYARIILSGKAA